MNRIVLGGQVIAFTAILMTGRVLLAHTRRRRPLVDLASLTPKLGRLRLLRLIR